jgi:aarF domain-containing kinase
LSRSTSEEFRKDYCRLWKAMVLMDEGELTRICKAWGVADSEFFASLQLLKPYTPKRGGVHLNSTTREDVLKFQVEAFDRVKALLGDSERVPRELILLGRNLNIVRANNKGMGSPVNRVNIMAKWVAQQSRVVLWEWFRF